MPRKGVELREFTVSWFKFPASGDFDLVTFLCLYAQVCISVQGMQKDGEIL